MPIDRWKDESSIESPWVNIASVPLAEMSRKPVHSCNVDNVSSSSCQVNRSEFGEVDT